MDENLKKVIPFIVDDDNEILISASDLHNFLEIEENIKDWFNLMGNYGFCEGEDYKKILVKKDGVVQNSLDYLMTIDMAKQVSFAQKSEKGKIARRYFNQVEKEFKKVQISLGKIFNMSQGNMVDKTSSEITSNDKVSVDNLALSNNLKTENIRNQILKRNSKISSNFNTDNSTESTTNQNTISSSTTKENTQSSATTNFRDTAKILGVRENLLVNWLILNHYCYRDKKGQIKPYAKFMDFFAMKSFITNNGYCGTQTFINNNGRQTFKNMLSDADVIKNKDELLE